MVFSSSGTEENARGKKTRGMSRSPARDEPARRRTGDAGWKADGMAKSGKTKATRRRTRNGVEPVEPPQEQPHSSGFLRHRRALTALSMRSTRRNPRIIRAEGIARPRRIIWTTGAPRSRSRSICFRLLGITAEYRTKNSVAREPMRLSRLLGIFGFPSISME